MIKGDDNRHFSSLVISEKYVDNPVLRFFYSLRYKALNIYIFFFLIWCKFKIDPKKSYHIDQTSVFNYFAWGLENTQHWYV